MLELHRTIIQLAVAYTLVGAFIFTVIVTCLSLIGIVEFVDKTQQKKLFYVLIVELVIIGVGFFGNVLTLNPTAVVEKTAQQVVENSVIVIDFQISPNLSPAKAKEVQQFIQQQGYAVEGIEKRPNFNRNQVRYFYLSQKESANQLQKKLLGKFKINNLESIYIAGYEGKAKLNHLEVWLKDIK